VSGDGGTDRTSVKTYVPRYQKDRWRARADDLDMTQSEFVRTMVQAGVHGLALDSESGDAAPAGETTGADDADLDDRVLAVLHERDVVAWDDFVEALANDFEARLEATLDALADEGVVKYSPREGGYVLREDR